MMWIEPPSEGHGTGVAFILHSTAKLSKPVLIRDAYTTLKELAVSGNLYFGKIKLSADLFSKIPITFNVRKNGPNAWLIEGFALLRQQEIPLDTVDLIGQGIPNWFIRGPILKFFDDSIQWKWLKEFKNKKLLLDDDRKELFLKDNRTHCRLIEEEIGERFPLLVIDKSGGFANLFLQDSKGKKISFCHASAEEKIWESDLLESGFCKKTVGSTEYYCPLDRVKKCLRFLLECGWKIEDSIGRQLYQAGPISYQLIEEKEHVHLKGQVDYGPGPATFGAIGASYRRNETFVSLSMNAIGLLPDLSLPDEGVLTSEGIAVKKNRFGVMKAWGTLFKPSEQPIRNFLFSGELRPYQQIGVNWLAFLQSKGFHGLLADEMGLGKTVQVLAFLANCPRALIIMPKTLLFNWKREIQRFLPKVPLMIHHGSERMKELPLEGLILTSYGTLKQDLSLFSSQIFSAIILDEAQAIKNPRSQIAQAVCELHGHFRLSMTGTPVENSRIDLWSQFRFLMPDLFGDYEAFANEDVESVKLKIAPFFLRRKKEDVAPELPEKIEQIVWIEMDAKQRSLYNRFVHDAKQGLLKKIRADGIKAHRMEILEVLLRLRQIACHPKLIGQEEPSAKWESLFADLETLIADKRKVIIYSQFTSMLSLMRCELFKRGWNALSLEGKTINREEVVSNFCDDENNLLLLMSLRAGGVGLNLSVADVILLYDPWWNEAVEAQAIARAHRIGRVGNVLAKRFIAIDTVEEKMVQLKEEKSKLADSIFDQDRGLSEADLEFLLG